MQALSLALGILSMLGLFIGFVPCLGALNWINIPFAVVGAIVSLVALNQAPPNKKGLAIAGLVMCVIAILLGAKRLMWGGGVL